MASLLSKGGELVFMHRIHREKRLALLVAAIFFISSCAGLRIFSGAQSEFDQGLTLFNGGSYDAAIPYFQRATEIDPDYARAYLYLGRSYLNLTRWRKAVPPLRTAFRLSPDETKSEFLNLLVDALFSAAITDLKLGNFNSSVGYFKEVLQLEPKSSRARNEIGGALIAHGRELLSKGDVSGAVSAFTEATRFSPSNLEATLGLARAFFMNGDFQKAAQAALDAMRVDPTNLEAKSFFRDLQRR